MDIQHPFLPLVIHNLVSKEAVLTLHTRALKSVRDNLVVSKSPKLSLSDNKETSVTMSWIILSIWNFRQLTWRNASKPPVHWVADKAENKTETHIDLPDDVPDFLDTTIVVKLTTKTTLTILAAPRRFVGQNKVMPPRLAFSNCTQRHNESTTDCEARLWSTTKKSIYSVIKDSLLEGRRGRLCIDVRIKRTWKN